MAFGLGWKMGAILPKNRFLCGISPPRALGRPGRAGLRAPPTLSIASWRRLRRTGASLRGGPPRRRPADERTTRRRADKTTRSRLHTLRGREARLLVVPSSRRPPNPRGPPFRCVADLSPRERTGVRPSAGLESGSRQFVSRKRELPSVAATYVERHGRTAARTGNGTRVAGPGKRSGYASAAFPEGQLARNLPCRGSPGPRAGKRVRRRWFLWSGLVLLMGSVAGGGFR